MKGIEFPRRLKLGKQRCMRTWLQVNLHRHRSSSRYIVSHRRVERRCFAARCTIDLLGYY